jgi:hypothetical protein
MTPIALTPAERELLAFLTATEHSRAKSAPLAAQQLELPAPAMDESRIRPSALPVDLRPVRSYVPGQH